VKAMLRQRISLFHSTGLELNANDWCLESRTGSIAWAMTNPRTSISALFASALCLLTMVCATAEPRPATVPSTPMEAALDTLRSRFPNQVVIGFEELWDVRPEREPYIDLGPANSTLEQVLARVRRDNPRYKVELLQGGLVHIHPAYDTADPAGLLDLRLREFFLPPDDCMAQQLVDMDGYMASFSYTPELSTYLWEHKLAWYRANGKEPGGVAGDFLGDCDPPTTVMNRSTTT
jgi:hypothetical protein